MLEFRILGPLEVIGDEGPLRLGGPKQRATLAILLLDANRLVSVDRLADALYSGAPPVTAVTQVQRQISELRKLGLAGLIETRSPGYLIRLPPEQLDLHRFERQADEAAKALERGEARVAADLLKDALELWRGAPLADLAYESFAQAPIERLEELRQVALEQRIDADLMLGRHAELVPELEALVFDHPLRERLRGQLMLALYQSGRQPEALEVYRRGRGVLVEELGIEPSPALRDLERAILSQDPDLDLEHAPQLVARAVPSERAVLVLPSRDQRLEDLLSIAEPLALRPGRELIIVRLLAQNEDVPGAADALRARRASLETNARTAAFATLEPAADAVRLARTYNVDLVLLDAQPDLSADRLSPDLAAMLDRSPADVAVLTGSVDFDRGTGVYVPFGGGEHDWGALELGAWLAFSAGVPLRVVGPGAETQRGRDSSRLLATASLAVQRVIGVEAEPVFAEPSKDGLLDAVDSAAVVVIGISERWRTRGIGAARLDLVRQKRPSVLLVHRGLRPGGLAPGEAGTRFSWTVEDRYSQAVSTAPM
jgi:DNA-binding SARP family transcriptional activator